MNYSVETREELRGGDDYSENHYDFDTADEVRDFIANDMHEDERLFAVLYYGNSDSNPKDVTSQFQKRKKGGLSRF